jgi:cytoskeletal protein CcmA (bactofilin family)
MSYNSMRGQTLSINDGNNSKLSFSDGTVQTTAYTGTNSSDLVVNNLTVQENLTVEGNETINGTLTANNLTINGTFTVEGSETINGTLLVDETLNVIGNTTIDGNLTVQENTSCSGELNILNDLTVYGNTFLGSNSSTSSTTIYGKVMQNLPNSCTSYGVSALLNLGSGDGQIRALV